MQSGAPAPLLVDQSPRFGTSLTDSPGSPSKASSLFNFTTSHYQAHPTSASSRASTAATSLGMDSLVDGYAGEGSVNGVVLHHIAPGQGKPLSGLDAAARASGVVAAATAGGPTPGGNGGANSSEPMLEKYIWDYLSKRGLVRTAGMLLEERGKNPAEWTPPPINAPQGLLFEWWAVFWEVLLAHNGKSNDASAIHYAQNRVSSPLCALRDGRC